MTSVTLNLNDDLVERAQKAAKEAGVSLEKMLARLVEERSTKNRARTSSTRRRRPQSPKASLT